MLYDEADTFKLLDANILYIKALENKIRFLAPKLKSQNCKLMLKADHRVIGINTKVNFL